MSEPDKQPMKGHMDLLLLSLLENGPLHGYAIIEELRRRSAGAFAMQEGTIYPALHRLEDAGQLVSEWSMHDGRKRREYSLSTAGRAALGTRSAQWHEYARAVDAVLNRFTAEPVG